MRAGCKQYAMFCKNYSTSFIGTCQMYCCFVHPVFNLDVSILYLSPPVISYLASFGTVKVAGKVSRFCILSSFPIVPAGIKLRWLTVASNRARVTLAALFWELRLLMNKTNTYSAYKQEVQANDPQSGSHLCAQLNLRRSE